MNNHLIILLPSASITWFRLLGSTDSRPLSQWAPLAAKTYSILTMVFFTIIYILYKIALFLLKL